MEIEDEKTEWDALDALVEEFACALCVKLRRKFEEGYRGWNDPCLREDLYKLIIHHIFKADWIDVGAFAAFL